MMRIGLDAKRAFNNTSGLGNYSRFVISGLLERFPQEEYFLFTPRVSKTFQQFYLPAASGKSNNAHADWHKALPALWRTFGLGIQI